MRLFGAVAALLLATPGFAADAAVAHQGDMLRDANNVRLGAVDAVNKDGSINLIYESRYLTVPANTLSIANGKLVTSMTRAQLTATH